MRRSLNIRAVLVAAGIGLFASSLVGSSLAQAQTEAKDDGTAEAKPKFERTTGQCIDKEIADRLAVKRTRRGSVDRLYVKQARHEFTALGGYYVSDLFSSTYVAGGSYTYHMTESTALEFSYAFTHANADVIAAIEAQRGEVIEDEFARTQFFEAALILTPVYGKLRLGGSIHRFDLHLDLGVGVVDSPTSRGPSGVAGLGFKLFATQWLALRVDVRDHVFQQELLNESFIVNDLSVTMGLSVFAPFSN